MRRRLSLLLLLLFLNRIADAAVQRESIGQLKIHDVLLRPNVYVREPQEGSFSLGESSFALRWELEDYFQGVIRVGSRELMNPTARYTPSVNDDIVLVEAFGEYRSPFGRFRMGRIPTEFGAEGALWERDLMLPRSLLFKNRVVELRDLGFSYFISHADFYTQLILHNGESENDRDGRIWYSGKWGYKFPDLDLGFSGETGSTKPSSTSTSGDTLAAVDVNKEALWRLGGLYADYTPRHWQVTLEIYGGEREQKSGTRRFGAGHLDISHTVSEHGAFIFRYDHFDPDFKADNDTQRAFSLGFELSNRTRTSNLILVGTKNLEESHQVPNDELRLIWSLSPSGIVHFKSRSHPSF